MRRLPVYFLVDVSEPIHIEYAKHLLNRFLLGIRKEPYLLETAYISIITFSDNAKMELPLTENPLIESIPQFETKAGKGCSLADAMCLLMDDIDKNVVKTTSEMKGDYKPVVFLLTGGSFIDTPTSVMTRWKLNYNKSTLITISIGEIKKTQLLDNISDAILSCNNIKDEDNACKLLSWIGFYRVEAAICSSAQEAKILFNNDLNHFLKTL